MSDKKICRRTAARYFGKSWDLTRYDNLSFLLSTNNLNGATVLLYGNNADIISSISLKYNIC